MEMEDDIRIFGVLKPWDFDEILTDWANYLKIGFD